MKVVIIYSEVLKNWGIVHASSYQKAFRVSFGSESDAVEFALKNNCEIKDIKIC